MRSFGGRASLTTGLALWLYTLALPPILPVSWLAALTASFVGRERAEAELPCAGRGMPIDRSSAKRAQELIARVVGTSSARALVTSALAGGTMSLPEVTRLLDEGGQSLRFSRQLLASTFENIDAGISVVDAEMNLVAWNTRYLKIFDYPPGLVQVGVPVAELIRAQCAARRFQARRRLCDELHGYHRGSAGARGTAPHAGRA